MKVAVLHFCGFLYAAHVHQWSFRNTVVMHPAVPSDTTRAEQNFISFWKSTTAKILLYPDQLPWKDKSKRETKD